MTNFWKVKTESYSWTAMELKRIIPELKNSNVEDIESYLRLNNISMIKEESVKVSPWIRMTLPFAFIFFTLLLVTLPIKYIITGTWTYKKDFLYNWLKSLGF